MSTENTPISLNDTQSDILRRAWFSALRAEDGEKKIQTLFHAVEQVIEASLTSDEKIKYRARVRESYNAGPDQGPIFLEVLATDLLKNRAAAAEVKRS